MKARQSNITRRICVGIMTALAIIVLPLTLGACASSPSKSSDEEIRTREMRAEMLQVRSHLLRDYMGPRGRR